MKKRIFSILLVLTFILGFAPYTKADAIAQNSSNSIDQIREATNGSVEKTGETTDIKAESKTALMETLKTLKNVKKYAFIDMTGDGVKDVFANGAVYTYVSKTKTVKKIQLVYNSDKKLKKYGKMYVSKKKKRIYFVSKDKKKYCGYDDKYCEYYTGWFYRMKDIKNCFDLDGKYHANDYRFFARVKSPKYFVPKTKYKKGRKYYRYDFTWDDQDDQWYKLLTTKQMKNKLNKMMPGMKKVKFISFTKASK